MHRTEPAPGRPRLLHITTTDMSLELLIGPQLEAFAAAGYEVHAASAPGPFVEAVQARGVTFHALEHSTRSMSLVADVRAAREVYSLIRELRADIVHTHNPKPGVYGRIAAKVARVPVIVNTVHGLYAQPSDRLRKRVVVYSLERFAALFSHVELVQNPEDVAVLRQLRVPASKLTVLGNGVDLGRFKPTDSGTRQIIRDELEIPEESIVVGAVGRLVEEKGYLELFEAMRVVRQANPHALLMVIGPHEPDKSDALSSEAMRHAEANGVRFLGHRADVEKLYHAMDVYVLASHREGFPRSAMEAAACGLPLVLTDIRGCRQVVDPGVTGLLVPVRQPQALADALIAVCADAATRAGMGAAGLRKAQQDFDQQRVITRTLDAYDHASRLRGSRPAAAE